ncbi:5810_t:CDS:2 [Acaulospora colombiana]|uniref:5810_t:CDS:1 n=1 Tax=Acaulospora colombiana TaxID=27376 RepID=A0ACA9K479_9GLOM|nr:5810_t:CDS:2 [Acaulospora colombiana]
MNNSRDENNSDQSTAGRSYNKQKSHVKRKVRRSINLNARSHSTQIGQSTSSRQTSSPSLSLASSRSHFTPRIIHLWIKNLESIAYLTHELNERLNSDFVSSEWVQHREEMKKANPMSAHSKFKDREVLLITSYLNDCEFSIELVQALRNFPNNKSAIAFRPPVRVKGLWDSLSKNESLTKSHKKNVNRNLGSLGNLPSREKNMLQQAYETITKLEERYTGFDPQYEELWDANVKVEVDASPYSVFNDVDNEKLPVLEARQIDFTFENLIHWDVDEPDEDYNYGCTCEDNCKVTVATAQLGRRDQVHQVQHLTSYSLIRMWMSVLAFST